MSKITIVSRPDQHLLIDISGCSSFKEAIEQLSAALLSANQFWQGTAVDLNLGQLLLTRSQLVQIIALTKGVGIAAKHILAEQPETAMALKELNAALETAANEETAEISSVAVLAEDQTTSETISNAEVDATLEQMIMSDDMGSETPLENTSVAGREMITNAESLSINPELVEKKEEPATISEEKKAIGAGKRQSLYIKQTLRAGQAVSHKGDLIIIGDVNAGAEVLAEGDITVWGSLRGIAHAGVGGNTMAEIRALRLQPIQLRIAHYIARSPDALLTNSSILSASPFMAKQQNCLTAKFASCVKLLINKRGK